MKFLSNLIEEPNSNEQNDSQTELSRTHTHIYIYIGSHIYYVSIS